jgi:hypothetical protein
MKIFCLFSLFFLLGITGCANLRFAPSEVQKQNAWLHCKTAEAVAEISRHEKCSDELCELSSLSETQSRAFLTYYGMPVECPKADNVDDILSEKSVLISQNALSDSTKRPDAFDVADNIFEIGLGFAALLGGVYGTRVSRFFKEAKGKSHALREVVMGNETFKKEHKAYAGAFKESQRNQSTQTKKIVAEIKV